MAPSILFLFLFLFHLFPLLILSDSSCPASFHCPGLGSLEFPFTNTRPDCGLFTVNCTNSSHPRLQLQPGGPWFKILKKIAPNKFSIRDPYLEYFLRLNSCDAIKNRTLPTIPFISFAISPTLTAFICINVSNSNPIETNRYFEKHNCLEFEVYYRNPANTSADNEIIVPHSCFKTELPVNSGRSSSNLFELLSPDFTVEWNISADCMSCHARGGQCTGNYLNEFLCKTTGAERNQPSQTTARSQTWITASVMSGAGVLLLGLAVFFWWKLGCCSQRKDTLEYELRGVNFQTNSFTYRQIKTATNSFSPANKIGEGGFGPVYKGTLSDDTVVAVKLLSSKSRQGNREFVTEIGMISAIQHPNLVKLYGCCVEGNNLLLIYEYMENNSLARALFGPEEYMLKLDWPTRHKICVGVAKGLAYLHEESALKIVHRDIKASNVLLDGNFIPKISDFGLAKLHEGDSTHITTRVAGTWGYMAPEYAMEGYLTDKADVYSFGVVLLEIVSGKTANNHRPEEFNLLGQAKFLSQNDNLMGLVDPRLESSCYKDEILATINIALTCTNFVGAERPSMSTVVSMLTGSSTVN